MTTLTIGALAKLDASHDELSVVAWLPGSRIDLCGTPRVFNDPGMTPNLSFFIEGNLREGSVLCKEES